MAIDFEAIKRKLAQISGQNKKSQVMWWPEEGKDHVIRIIAMPDNEGQPFVDRWFYYNIGGEKARSILAPFQFGNPDPIQDLITQLREDGTPESKELCKKLYPKMRTYAAVIVRGEEEKGVRLWSFGKIIYQDLLRLMLDEDYGDITDINTGRDLKVTSTQVPGKRYSDTKVTPRGSSTPLSKDKEQIKEWLSSIPNIDDYEQCPSTEEIERRISAWLNGPDESEGTTLGSQVESSPTSFLDDDDDDDDFAPTTKKSKKATFSDLNSAFSDLED